MKKLSRDIFISRQVTGFNEHSQRSKITNSWPVPNPILGTGFNFQSGIVIQVTATSHNSESAEHGSSHKTCFEKHWKENVDYFKVENPIVCHDGESIQVEA